MRFLTFAAVSIIALLFSSSSFAQDAKQYVKVTEGFVNVYTELNPKSAVVATVSKGEYLELIASGDLWYKVKMGDKEGWLEKRAGEVTNKAGNGSATLIIIILLLVAGAFGGVAWYIYKSKLGAINSNN